ncbi:mitochondrial carrier domain-containing protein [Xylaria grammica]|nr:mitochondrial carrier domain-containing protein [Xylaria grammica]
MPPSSPPPPPPSSSPSPSPTTNSALPPLHHALSGSLGTLISTCSLYPLSLVIARLQVQRQLCRRREEDRPGRAPGYDPGPAHPGPGPSDPPPIPTTRAPTSPPPGGPPPPSEQVDTQRAPARDRDRQPKQPTAKNVGIVDVFSQIWSSDGDGGLRAFYTGLAQDAPKSALDSFLFFLFYEWFRALYLRSRRRVGRAKIRGLGVLIIGSAAGACSRAFTTPIANVVTRRQMATLLGPNTHGAREIAHSIRKEKGLAGFWSGYSASLVLTLNPSLTFFLQEFLKTTFAENTYDDPGPRLTFLFAATSKAISSVVTYPFQIAKTRLQAGVPLGAGELDQEQSGKTHEVNLKPDKRAEDERDDEGQACENKTGTVRTVQKLAQQSIFGTVAHIIRTEGIGSLYDGVGAELLKGFFSHGTTMLAKDVVHKLLFKLYIFVLGALAELRKRKYNRTTKGAT